ncbi:MAG: NAD(P)H-dependent glycerol-3-phosphate dehydrogenase [Elusimicrobiota bacterium]|jgi:glycerol-3-phosphate dehydrogenase (NAD(P)+)
MNARREKVCVLGGGIWGTALANHLAGKGRPVVLWEYFAALAARLERTRRHPHIPDLRILPPVRVVSDLEEAVRDAGVLLVVLPSTAVRATMRRLRPLVGAVPPRPIVVNASKGVERGSLRTMGEVLHEELPHLEGRIFTLSGPSFAREVARGVPTRMVLAGPPVPAAREVRRLLEGGTVRVVPSDDQIGVELAGSLKNVVAIGAGILDGLRLGANTKAALMTQGVAEMGQLVERLGGRRETIYGLCGLGDLIATGTSQESRNRGLGERLGRGRSLRRALAEIDMVVEGVESAQSALELLHSCGFKAPLLEAVWGVVHGGRPPKTVVEALGFSTER